MDIAQVIPKAVRHLREDKGLSLEQFAEKAGLQPRDIIALEDGIKFPGIKQVDALFHCFDVNVFEYLVNVYRSELLIKPGEINPIIDRLLLKSINKLTWVRLVICVIHADKILVQSELNRLREMIEQLKLTEKEKEIVRKDLHEPLPLRELIKELEIPEEASLRKFLVKKTMEAALFDDVLDPLEEQVIKDIMTYLKLDDTAY